jgi:glycosyltransferase involved in cell wall biosynthesis
MKSEFIQKLKFENFCTKMNLNNATVQGKSAEIWISFLGRKGGGVTLLNETESILLRFGVDFSTLVSNQELSTNQATVVIKTPSLKISEMWRFLTFPVMSFQYFYKKRNDKPKMLVQLMPSPMDYWLDLWCKIFKIYNIRAIHDLEPHLGERWPSKGAIQMRIKNSCELLFFSKFVLDNASLNKGQKYLVCSLPSVFYSKSNSTQDFRVLLSNWDFPRILFIGRLRKYKGLNFLIKSFADPKYEYLNFLIAGEGESPENLGSNFQLLNRWLDEKEIEFLIENSDVVVFPYLEASQSGLIPLARQKRRILLVSDVGGLAEQVEGYSRKVLFKANDEPSIRSGMEISLDLLNQDDLEDPKVVQTKYPTVGEFILERIGHH